MKDLDMKELNRRAKKGVRNFSISPLFEAGKLYNIDRSSPNYQKEDETGTMRPNINHCYLDWQSKWIDEERTEHWGDETMFFNSIEEAEEAKNYLLTK